MDTHAFVARLLPLRDEEAERFIAEHASEVDDLDKAAELLRDEWKLQDGLGVELSLLIAGQLLSLARWTGSPRHRAMGLLARGNSLLRQGHHREAIACLDASAADFLSSGDEVGWARTRISYLYCAPKVGLLDQAFKQAEQAHEIFKRHNEDERVGDLETNLAYALMEVGRYQEALAAYDRALAIRGVADTPEALVRKARVLTNKALVLEMLGDLEEAIFYVQEARAIFAEQGQLRAVATADHNQATLRAGLGQYSAALHFYHQAREYYQQQHLLNRVAFTNANMADCLLRLNRAREALHLAEESVALYRTLDETPDLGWALVYLARVQAACGQVPQALKALPEALQCFKSVRAVAATGLVLLIQAELSLFSENQIAQALASVQEALRIFQTYGMESWIAEARLLQGRACEASGDLDRAAALAEQARAEARQSHLPWLEFGCEHLLGRLAQRRGELESAESHYQAALKLLEGLMIWLVRDQRSTFLADKEGVFGALIDLSLDRQNPARALEYLERMKSQVLREYLTRSDDIRLKASNPDEAHLLQELQRLRRELHWYSSQVAQGEKALQSTEHPAQPQGVRGAPVEAASAQIQPDTLLNQQKDEQRRREQVISDLLERAFLQHESSRFAFLSKPGEESLQYAAYGHISVERLAELLPAQSVLLEYFILGNDLFIFTLHPRHRQVGVKKVPGVVSVLHRLLLLFRTNIDLVAQQLALSSTEIALDRALLVNAHGLARRLYDILLQPVESHIPSDGRLLIVPYGPLHMLPFHALQSKNTYLIEQCEVAYLPAAAMLSLQAERHTAVQASTGSQRSALVLGHSYGGRLPHALQEAQSIAALLGGSCYLEDQATIETLGDATSHHKIIHIAAHGQNRADAPDFSHLQLADGQLSMIDVFNLDLPAELVTLSGCETGLAVVGGGDELLGLGRGFLYAGARSLLISLWHVEDSSTAYFMERFYQSLLAGNSKAGALRAAQLALLVSGQEEKERGAWQHPYFWAPFRLLGDSGPLVF